MADNCGPYLKGYSFRIREYIIARVRAYRAALSYSSKSGIARSFMFFGTARTSVVEYGVSLYSALRWYRTYFALGVGPGRVSCILWVL
jgi:hypothetical protein